MSTATMEETMEDQKTKGSVPASIVWFEVPADNIERAKNFYNALFGWKTTPIPGMPDYWHIDTGGADASPDGAVMKRKQPQQQITNYILVESVEASVAKLMELGGKVSVPKTTVPQMGYFAICQDTEKNTFGIWQHDPGAK